MLSPCYQAGEVVFLIWLFCQFACVLLNCSALSSQDNRKGVSKAGGKLKNPCALFHQVSPLFFIVTPGIWRYCQFFYALLPPLPLTLFVSCRENLQPEISAVFSKPTHFLSLPHVTKWITVGGCLLTQKERVVTRQYGDDLCHVTEHF